MQNILNNKLINNNVNYNNICKLLLNWFNLGLHRLLKYRLLIVKNHCDLEFEFLSVLRSLFSSMSFFNLLQHLQIALVLQVG